MLTNWECSCRMSYTDQKLSGGKIGAMVIVALLHIALAYAFVTGLAYQYIQKAKKDLNTFEVPPPPPPPPDVPPPPPPPDQKFTPPPVVAPPPIVHFNVPSPPVFVTPVIAPPQPPAPPPPAPAPPAPPHISQAAQSKGTPASWYTNDDYPPGALRAEASGRVSARLTIGTDGRVSGCAVTASSGNDDLDSATCRIAQRRGRYSPAKDENGNPIASSSAIAIRWVVPKE